MELDKLNGNLWKKKNLMKPWILFAGSASPPRLKKKYDATV